MDHIDLFGFPSKNINQSSQNAASKKTVEIMNWIKVTEQLPQPQKLVQIAYQDKFVTVGWYCGKFQVEGDFDFDDDWDVDEETDKIYVSEGWRSQCLESEEYYPITEVTHWAPLFTNPNKQ